MPRWHSVGALPEKPATFRSADMLQILGAACKASHRHPPLLDAVASHVLRGMRAYPLYALCNTVNLFARLEHHHQLLFSTAATFLAEPSRAAQLSSVDLACLVFAYAQCGHQAGHLLEACAVQLKRCHLEVGGPNCATILNSYARLSLGPPGREDTNGRGHRPHRP